MKTGRAYTKPDRRKTTGEAGISSRGTLEIQGGTLESAVLGSKTAFRGTLEEKKEVSHAYAYEREIPKKCHRCPPGVPPLGSKQESRAAKCPPDEIRNGISLFDLRGAPFANLDPEGIPKRREVKNGL